MGIEEWGFDPEISCEPTFRENWENGIHIDQNGNEYRIKDLLDGYLLNIIRYFDLDEKDKNNNLIKEAIKRQLIK